MGKGKHGSRQKSGSPNAETDISSPQFQADLRALSVDDQRAVIDALRQLRSMAWPEIYKHRGLRWEQIHSIPPPASLEVDKWFSIRLTGGRRARVYRTGNVMRFVDIPPDHDSTYK